MDKKHAIDAINEAEANGAKGFQVFTINEEDIENYAPKHIKEGFGKLNEEQKRLFLSTLIDEMYYTLEQDDRYGFKKLMNDTIEACENDGMMLFDFD